MSEDFNPTMESLGLNQGAEKSGEKREGASEADIARVEAQTQKAKQMAGISAQNKQQNGMIADFLAILMQKISSDSLLAQFHRTFFRVTDKYGQKRVRKTTNNTIMIGLFVPFFQDEVDACGLTNYFSSLYEYGKQATLENYVVYLQNLCFHHLEKIPVDKEQLIELIIEIVLYFNLVDNNDFGPEKKQDIADTLEQRLFDQKVPPASAHPHVHTPHNPDNHGKHGHHNNPYPRPQNEI